MKAKAGLPPDYHIHTPLCGHAEGEVVAYLQHAVRRGLTEIGFSEHAPMPQDDFDDWRMKRADLDRYIEIIQKAAKQVPGITVRIGLEVDYIPGYEDWIRELSDYYDWDYLIGSVHYVGEWCIDDPRKAQRWDHVEIMNIWIRYVELLIKAVTTRVFDIIGHIDLCKVFGHRLKGGVERLYEPFIQLVAEKGVAIELNTGGLRKPCREMYPSETILKLAAEYEVGLVFGSDAHKPEEVGHEFESAMAAAQVAGYESYLRFSKRRALRTALRIS